MTKLILATVAFVSIGSFGVIKAQSLTSPTGQSPTLPPETSTREPKCPQRPYIDLKDDCKLTLPSPVPQPTPVAPVEQPKPTLKATQGQGK